MSPVEHEARPPTHSLLSAFREYVDFKSSHGEAPWGHEGQNFRGHGGDAAYIDGVLLSNTLFNYEKLRETPACSVVIPVAFSEPLTNVTLTLDNLLRGWTADGALEVWLWANTKLNDVIGNDANAEAQSQQDYDFYEKLTDHITAMGYPADRLRIRVIQRIMDDATNFNDIRSDYMSILAYDAVTRNFPYSHPVIWLDGDVTFAGNGSINQMVEAINAHEAYFIKGNLMFSGEDWANPPLSMRSPTEKIAAVYSITRRVLERTLAPEDAYGYIDECGLGFQLGDYLRAGGVATTDPTQGETRTLLKRASERLPKNIPLFKRLTKARLGTSYRRFVYLAGVVDPLTLPFTDEGDDYQGYQILSRLKLPVVNRLTNSDAQAMVETMVRTHEEKTGAQLSAEHRARLSKIVGRCAFDQI